MNEHYVQVECKTDYLKNTWSNFLHVLETPLWLEGKWVVALDEISFPCDWTVKIELRHKIHTTFPEYSAYESTNAEIHTLFFNMKLKVIRLKDFCDNINRILTNCFNYRLNDQMLDFIGMLLKKLTDLSQNYKYLDKKEIDKLILKITDIDQEFKTINISITDLTNFDMRPYNNYNPFFNNIYLHNLEQIIKLIHVNLDIIPFPNTIKTCHIKGIYSSHYSETWAKSQYYQINKTYIDQIKIELKDSFKNHISFNRGAIYAKLHFKKQK
jgi:hypothetical protein